MYEKILEILHRKNKIDNLMKTEIFYAYNDSDNENTSNLIIFS